MGNRILGIKVRTGQLIPAQAEVWVTVTPEQQTPATEVRGRFMGPSCPYASTVEVAYPLRSPLSGHLPPGSTGITRQAIIPEASFWDTDSPFLYRGVIELWQDGCCCDRAILHHGLRSFLLGDRGLRLNFQSISLRGRAITVCSEEELRLLHRDRYNLLVAPVEETALPLWDLADRLGFLTLGRVIDDNERTLQLLEMMSRHTSCLGWVAGEARHPPLDRLPNSWFQGWACTSAPLASLMGAVNGLVGPLELANLGKPLLVRGNLPAEPPEGSVILGTID